MAKIRKADTVQDVIDFLNHGDTSRSVNFFHGDGGLEDDQRQPFTIADIDDSMDDVVDINIPTIATTEKDVEICSECRGYKKA
jgi:hypothetical protein